MNTSLYMAISANGYIAGPGDNVDWVSEDSWKSYMQHVGAVDGAVIGRKTYDLMPEDEFVEGCAYAVFTSQSDLVKKTGDLMFGASPSEILSAFSGRGLKNICILGGGQTNTAFLRAGLIDELHLDVEPVVVGSGTPLFSESKIECDLELVGTKQLSNSCVQLRYKVQRS